MKNRILLFVNLLSLYMLLQSCSDCNYSVTQDYIQSNCPFEDGFYFEKIKIDSLDADGFPINYEVEKTFPCGIAKPELEPSKKIFFYSKTENYVWVDMENARLLDTLPIIMEPNNWYLVRGLMFLGNPNVIIFIFVNEDGKFSFFHSSVKTSW